MHRTLAISDLARDLARYKTALDAIETGGGDQRYKLGTDTIPKTLSRCRISIGNETRFDRMLDQHTEMMHELMHGLTMTE